MQLRSFESLFPKMVQDNEFYVKIPFDMNSDSKRTYRIVDLYCPDAYCDCHKVTLLFCDRQMKVVSNVSYGWQPKKFYQNWGLDEKCAQKLTEGYLDVIAPYSEHPALFLKAFHEIKKDKEVIERFKRRYALFKEKILATPELQI